MRAVFPTRRETPVSPKEFGARLRHAIKDAIHTQRLPAGSYRVAVKTHAPWSRYVWMYIEAMELSNAVQLANPFEAVAEPKSYVTLCWSPEAQAACKTLHRLLSELSQTVATTEDPLYHNTVFMDLLVNDQWLIAQRNRTYEALGLGGYASPRSFTEKYDRKKYAESNVGIKLLVENMPAAFEGAPSP